MTSSPEERKDGFCTYLEIKHNFDPDEAGYLYDSIVDDFFGQCEPLVADAIRFGLQTVVAEGECTACFLDVHVDRRTPLLEID